ncbi:hypothetical protein K438DRAFT_998688 [Mycena galopus ATCC 62051]|nr:hypothetical protein K438DRAFT_998688 [Mycena galopus ATCC 62051]
MFERARAMRALYAYLQACLLHPALKEFHADRRDFLAVLQRFEEQRKSMIKDENKQEINGLQRDLNSKKDKADALIRRYNFIRIVLNMDKHIISYPPSLVNGLQFYRWDCGKTGDATKLKSKLEAYNLVCFEPSYRAFELEWQSPVTEGSSILPRLLGGTSPRENMIFHTQSSNDVLPPLPPPSSKSHKLSKARPGEQQPETEDPGAFTFCLTNHKPVYILGWSLSCYWPVGKPEPTIEVDHPTNHIFSDRLSISIDNSRSTQWHCKVTFVIKSAYNFPDLLM